MRLAVKPDVDLPTMPTIRVYAVIGFPKVNLNFIWRKQINWCPLNLDSQHSHEALWPCALFLHAEVRVHHSILYQGSFLAIPYLFNQNCLRTTSHKKLLLKGQGGWRTQTGEVNGMAIGTCSPRQPRGWWESITTDDGLPPPEVLTYDEYTFKYLGMENDEERNGTVRSGESATTNLKSPGK